MYNKTGKEENVLKIFHILNKRRAEFSQNIHKLLLYDKDPQRKTLSLSLSQKLLGLLSQLNISETSKHVLFKLKAGFA